jgi:chitinase
VYDAKTVSTYSYAGTTWIGYDDSRSTTVKLEFAQALGLRGYFLWALSYDSEWEISKQGKPVSGHELQLPFRELF